MRKAKSEQQESSKATVEKRSAERPLFRLSSRKVYEQGTAALKARDRSKLAECIAELDERESQLAAEWFDELELKAENLLGPRAPRHIGAAFPIDASELQHVTVLTDDTIVRTRAEMVERAAEEIWLSSYIWRDADPLTKLLMAKAKIAGGVHVIISSGPCRSDKVQEHIESLRGAGVHVYCRESSHSKCVVVDGIDVLLGSANVDRSHRDLSLRARGAGLARSVRAYLVEVSRPQERSDASSVRPTAPRTAAAQVATPRGRR